MCRLTSYRDAAATEHEITNISFRLGDGCLLFKAVTRGPKRRGEARLHGAVRRLSGLCLTASWKTATNLTDWLFECWNNRKSPAKLRDSRGNASQRCLQYKSCGCLKWCICMHPCVCSSCENHLLCAASSIIKQSHSKEPVSDSSTDCQGGVKSLYVLSQGKVKIKEKL